MRNCLAHVFQVFSEARRLRDARGRTHDPSLLVRARNLFELSVWSTSFARRPRERPAAGRDAGRDAKNVLDLFELWGQTAGQPVDWLSAIADGKNDLSLRAGSEGIESLDGRYMRVEDAASQCGLKDMFKTMNKIPLNSHTQPPCQILGMADDEKQSLQRDTFYALAVASSSAPSARLKSVPFARDQYIHEAGDNPMKGWHLRVLGYGLRPDPTLRLSARQLPGHVCDGYGNIGGCRRRDGRNRREFASFSR